MSIEMDAAGRPHIRCPVCGRIHLVRRNKKYADQAQNRARCGHCKTTWRLTPEEVEKIKAAYTGEPKKRKESSKDENTPPKPSGDSWKKKLFGVDE